MTLNECFLFTFTFLKFTLVLITLGLGISLFTVLRKQNSPIKSECIFVVHMRFVQLKLKCYTNINYFLSNTAWSHKAQLCDAFRTVLSIGKQQEINMDLAESAHLILRNEVGNYLIDRKYNALYKGYIYICLITWFSNYIKIFNPNKVNVTWSFDTNETACGNNNVNGLFTNVLSIYQFINKSLKHFHFE